MGWGDSILAAGHAQSVYDADPSKRVAICDLQWRPYWNALWDGNPVIASPREVASGEPVHKIQNATGCRPYIQYPFTTRTGWTFTSWRAQDHRGKLYLSLKERALGIAAQQKHGPFVVMEPSPIAKSNPNKAWPREKFAGLIAACPDVRFVQLVHPESSGLAGALPIPSPTFRAACAVLASAAAYVGPEGGLHHAAAALGVSAVVIFGGCASVRTTGYAEHVNLADDGPQTPCGRWLPCPHCVDAMAKISVEQVADALRDVLVRAEADRLLEIEARRMEQPMRAEDGVMVRPAGAGQASARCSPPVVIQTIPTGAAEVFRE